MERITLDTRTIAKKAAARIRGGAEFQQRRASFPADDVAMLEVYVEQAYNALTELGEGLDPLMHAPQSAEQCMVEYAVEQWLGRDGFTTERAQILLLQWKKAGRVAQHRMKYAE